jgi:hypothetical protein
LLLGTVMVVLAALLKGRASQYTAVGAQ